MRNIRSAILLGSVVIMILMTVPNVSASIGAAEVEVLEPIQVATQPPEVTLPRRPAVPTTSAPASTPVSTPVDRVIAVDGAGDQIYGADPALVRDGDVWRLFTTQRGWSSVPTWESIDMVTWTWTGDALPELPEWAGFGQTWAPDAVELDGQWVLFFAALHGDSRFHCIGHAVADNAAGPYEAFADPLVCELGEGGSIDPMVHIDEVGDPHLLWKVDANAIDERSVLRSQRLSTDGLELVGEPSDLLAYEAGWEAPLIEQPEIIEVDGVVHLFYAGGWWNTSDYQIGHAVCESVAGPCIRTSVEQGWISSSDGFAGPGALSVESTETGFVGVYHAWVDGADPHEEDVRALVVERLALRDAAF